MVWHSSPPVVSGLLLDYNLTLTYTLTLTCTLPSLSPSLSPEPEPTPSPSPSLYGHPHPHPHSMITLTLTPTLTLTLHPHPHPHPHPYSTAGILGAAGPHPFVVARGGDRGGGGRGIDVAGYEPSASVSARSMFGRGHGQGGRVQPFRLPSGQCGRGWGGRTRGWVYFGG